MPRTAAERQALKREREALGLLECRAWIPGELFEPLINGGAITAEQSQDRNRRGALVALVFLAWVEKELSQRDSQPAPLVTISPGNGGTRRG